MRSFFSYYGGKWRMTPLYSTPRYETIIEPFAGAAGYSTRYADRRIILVEKDPVITALWRFLISASHSEIISLPLIRPGEDLRDFDIRPEARSLIGFWINKGSSRPRNVPTSWMKTEISEEPSLIDGIKFDASGFWDQDLRDRIALQVGRIRHWRIIEGDYTSAPDIEATWFIDPPYIGKAGLGYHHGSDAIDFDRLAAWCKERRGQVIVCENDGATWLPFRHLASTAGQRGLTHEAIWTNEEPPPADESIFDLFGKIS